MRRTGPNELQTVSLCHVCCHQTLNVAFLHWPLVCVPWGRVWWGRLGNQSLLIKRDTFHYDQKLQKIVSRLSSDWLFFFHFTGLRLGGQWGRWETEKSRHGSFDVSRCTTHSCFCRCPFSVKFTLKCSPTFLLSVWAWNNLIAHATAEGLTLTEIPPLNLVLSASMNEGLRIFLWYFRKYLNSQGQVQS